MTKTDEQRLEEVLAERDLLGRQQQAVIDLANQAETAGRSILPEELYRLVTTDPDPS